MAILECILVAFAVPMISSKSMGGQHYVMPNDTQTCVDDLIAWCDSMKYSEDGNCLSVVGVTVVDSKGYCRANCISDSEGTNCTKNGSPWFNCSKQNQLFYKGHQLSKDSIEGADNETCKTAENAFNDLFVQNLSCDKTMEMDEFYKAMADMQNMFSRMFGSSFPYWNRYPMNPDRSETTTNTQRETEK